MALFKIFKGDSTNLGVTGGTDNTRSGFAYFTPDDGKFYIDVTDNELPIIGSSVADGANRICINSKNNLSDDLVLDCGMANGWTETTINYFNVGGSFIDNTLPYVIYDGGDSNINNELEFITYDGGDSFYNV